MRRYRILNKNVFTSGNYSLVPIRQEDRFDIMQWRNEQIYHLRQSRPLTVEDQDDYFETVVSTLFESEQPNQLLFSYLEGNTCIGYGGLVHINWQDRNAEISFIMNTSLENEHFHNHWKTYLGMIEQVAFDNLNLHKIYTYAYDLRPHLYPAIEAAGFIREATLKEHCLIESEYKNVIIHSKIRDVTIRPALVSDVNITYEWANDPGTRENSFSSGPISLETHKKWWSSRMQSEDSAYFIGQVKNTPACLIRFDRDAESGKSIIGINISPAFRGRGLAHRFLAIACQKFMESKNTRVDAYIKAENTASLKAFQKAGFDFREETEVNGQTAYIYQLIR